MNDDDETNNPHFAISLPYQSFFNEWEKYQQNMYELN